MLGRINEVGEKQQPNAMTDVVARNTTTLGNWLNFTNSTYPHKQVSRTVYDVASTINQVYDKFRQHAYTLRNRVSYVQYFDQLQYSNNAPTYLNYNQATYYNYDIHGNVDTLLHDYATGAMAGQGFNRFKVVAYAYDLISGKVNLVTYQPGLMDALYHRYAYDAENRLTDVYTTTRRALVGNRTVEERDAAYSYYRHGPLARTEVGNHRVQGLDYAYTLQGWLKGMNSVAQTPTADQGQDGVSGSPGSSVRDAFGFSLNYFAGDYKAINPTVVPFPAANAYITTGYKPLFNGNISHMQVAIRGMKTLLYNYGYDQLNRLSSMRAFQGYDSLANTWSGLTSAGKYSEDITYDANGNIVTYNRDGDKTSTSLPMDRLTYYYKSGKNQLDYVQDNVGAAVYTEDIDGQTAGNYQYDAIGNLISDQKEGLTAIEWTVYGKIRKITKSTGQVITYTYDVSGNRISKAVTTGGNVETTWYVRDAQGNTLATYRINSGGITLSEQYLFGSSRLGAINRNLPLTSSLTVTSSTIPGIGVVYPSIVRHGEKQYELANHLGNVLAVVSDRRKPIFTGGSLSHYEPDLVSSTDYYPFGMAMPGRSLNAGGYRYGFNGKENDNEVKGTGNQQDYGMRIYDPRIGKFLSVDPLYKEYPWYTPYQFAGNRPIQSVDVDGAEENSASTYVYKSPVLSLQKKDPIQERVNAIKKQYNKIMWDARSVGANVAADNLQHFLNGSGTNRVLAASWIRSFGSISNGEDRIKGYYVERNVPDWASGMQEGQSITKSDHWVADISNYNPFSELSYASGASKITANGSFNLSKKGDNIAVSGTVTMNWNDPYDWHAGLDFFIPGTGSISDNDALFVQKHGGAKPFEMKSAWTYTFSGTYNSKTGDWSDVKWIYNGQVAPSSSSGTTTQGNQQSASMRDNRREYRRERDQRRTRENTRRD